MRRRSPLRLCQRLALYGLLLAGISACLGQLTHAGIETQYTPAPNGSRAPTVTLALMGDLMLGRGVHPSDDTFAALQPKIQSADLALANLESPLTGSASQTLSPYALCARPEYAALLASTGFDLLSLANNHRLDCGQDGLLETQNSLVKAGLGYIGPGTEAVVRVVNGLRLAFLAFDATAHFELEAAAMAVQNVRKTGAVVVVSIHWGTEYQSGASHEQRQIAARLVDSGAALIWGHHPHVLQPAARIRDSLVLFSLGNAMFDQEGLASTRKSALLLVTLDSAGVRAAQAMPFIIDVPGSRIVQVDPETDAEYFTTLGSFNR